MADRCINVIGAGLAGCEAAWQAAKRGVKVRLYEMKPKKFRLPTKWIRLRNWSAAIITFRQHDKCRRVVEGRDAETGFLCNEMCG